MKTLKFHFCHPVKGIVRLLNMDKPENSRVMAIDTHEDEVADIDIAALPAGKWKAAVEWEHDGKDYFYEKLFEVKLRLA